MKYLLLITLFTPLFSVGQTINPNKESYFGRSYEIGTSVTYITHGENPGAYYYQELTWNMNAKMRLSKLFWFGVQANPIFTKQFTAGLTSKTNYNFLGLIIQGDIYSGERGRIYLETSFNKSNMINDNIKLFPYLHDDVYYLGFGGGGNILLNPNSAKNLYLELAFFNYHVLNKIENKSNYTQYIVGLNYRFGRKG